MKSQIINTRPTEEQMFLAYEAVRLSGRTNMLDLNRVANLAITLKGVLLNHTEIISIIKDYDNLAEKYLS